VDLETLEWHRKRTVRALFAGVALTATGWIAAITVGTLAARELGGSAVWGGIPSAVAVLGTAAGAALLSTVSVRRGRRAALVLGSLIGAAGALMATLGIGLSSILVLIVGTFVLGSANAAGQLSRYIGGDLYPASRRASAVGTVIWGSTIGAVIGPNLLAPAGSVAEVVDLPPLAGTYLVTAAVLLLAGLLAFALLRPDPASLADDGGTHESGDRGTVGSPLRELLGRSEVATALLALAAAQVVMTMVMTMTPLHLTEHGHGLGVVGLVLSAHTLGMFALAPVSGRLTDRFGSMSIILAGFGLLVVAALLAALAPADGVGLLFVALFLLGFGWNLSFVAGSSLLAGRLPLADRARVQGAVDGIIWTSSAASSVAAGPLLAVLGYPALALIGAGLAVVPGLVVAARSRRPLPRPA
jgi:MFS family permease